MAKYRSLEKLAFNMFSGCVLFYHDHDDVQRFLHVSLCPVATMALPVSLVVPPLPSIVSTRGIWPMTSALLPTVDDCLDGFSNVLARSPIVAESLEALKELARWVLETLSPSVNQYQTCLGTHGCCCSSSSCGQKLWLHSLQPS